MGQNKCGSREPGFHDVVKAIYPCSMERHFKAMDYWVKKAEQGVQYEAKTQELYDMSRKMRERQGLPTASQSDLERWRRVFREMDSSNDGFLSADELLCLGGVCLDELKTVLAEQDTDGDGILDMEEFLQLMCHLEGMKMPEGDH